MKIKLTDEEKELELSFERNEWKSVSNRKSYLNKFKIAAKNTLAKDKRMNIRIAGKDIQLLKTKALEIGIPYQTLVSSILHQYVTGKLKEQ
ncbi:MULTISPECIES: antitoxin [Leptospira]|uniref:Antitoxin n=2 Tax=Leptospira TaxID=171 RepID=A0A6H3NVM3_9LEPT|nr:MULTISPECIES: antitoxin [Leptospira]MCG6154127.1 antitoxin [Leptospira bandrabouensis]PJZ86839.1 antitoxin [Leptospira levettii]TGN03905.1 antitoxin [Leptospira bandrabouensis]TGN13225.1 antitoxin [Leptospira bandrabouensis]